MNVSRPRKLLAVVAVVPLIFAGLISTAFGQLGTPSPEYQINTGKQGSITVHKYKNPTGVLAAATGKQLKETSQLGETMNDVTFTITQLKKTQSEDFDFSKSGDIIFASQLKAEQFVDFTTGEWKSNMEGFKGKKRILK
ncbi:hypothetical protein [Arcanobacterium hippocoleae]|uniref:hypothetical protein n=1 Tax=Arcanobacterium hippocoleae TaxID=149017 RepID=UPI0033429DAB